MLIFFPAWQNGRKTKSWSGKKLQDLGLCEAADVLSSSLPWEVDNYSVRDYEHYDHYDHHDIYDLHDHNDHHDHRDHYDHNYHQDHQNH